ncbi:benzoate transporter [Pantoea sp. ACRSB]|uniref:benzoate transporter n=1 Tax=Pantoea sp. ACRSB TaxID=2918207 RepID=UPI003908A336
MYKFAKIITFFLRFACELITMIYDCFLYYDEDLLLELRLHTLHAHVDKFVIVESLYTFTGKKRDKLNFDIEKFSAFRDQIIYVVNDTPPTFYEQEFFSNSSLVKAGETDPWENESTARNSIMKGLVDAKDNDVIIVSDVDEIPRPEALSRFSRRHICTTLYQNFYNFKFNVQVLNDDGSPRLCKLPKMVTFKRLKHFFHGQPELLRNVKRKGTPVRECWWRWRLLKLRTHVVYDAGWHFSWVMSDDRISEKMATISHTEHNLPEFNNPDHIRRCVEQNIDIWNRPRKMAIRPVTKELMPDWLVDNQSRFEDFIK